MMNNGVIIDKGTPDDLIAKHGKKNLEEVKEFAETDRGAKGFGSTGS